MVENNVNMDKFEKRAVIKYLFLKGISGKAIHDDMLDTLGNNALAHSVVKSWLPSSSADRTARRQFQATGQTSERNAG